MHFSSVCGSRTHRPHVGIALQTPRDRVTYSAHPDLLALSSAAFTVVPGITHTICGAVELCMKMVHKPSTGRAVVLEHLNGPLVKPEYSWMLVKEVFIREV